MDRQSGYMDRALKARDPRFARVLDKLGYSRSDMTAASESSEQSGDQELAALREQYQAEVGKKPYHGWDAETLAEKIKAAKSAD